MTQGESTQTSYQPPPPDAELQRLTPLLGKWKANDHTQDSILGDGSVTVKWWLRDSEENWQPWMTNIFTGIQ